MKDLLRRGLDAYEGRGERRDEELADALSRGVAALSDRGVHRTTLAILSTINALIWLSVLIVPHDVSATWVNVTDLDAKLGVMLVGTVFGIGMWLTSALLRLKYPDIEDQSVDDGVFSSVSYHARAHLRFRVWVGSTAGGVVNALAIAIVEGLRISSN